MRSFPLVLAALLASTAACAQGSPPAPWVVFFRDLALVVSVDTSRITTSARGLDLWMRFDQKNPAELSDQPGKTYTSSQLRHQIDCAGGTFTVLAMLHMDSTGAVVDEYHEESRRYVIREHTVSHVYRTFCGWIARHERRAETPGLPTSRGKAG